MSAAGRQRGLLGEVLGGIAPGLPVCLCGPIGSGRTVLCLDEVDATLGQGGSVVVLTAEPARLLLQQAASMGLALEEAHAAGRLELLELEPDAPATTRAHGGEALACAILAVAPEPTLVVADPLTALTPELLDEREMRATIRGLFEPLAAAGCAVVVTAEREAVEESPAFARAIKDACGIFAELDPDDAGGHVLRVTKARTGGVEEHPVAFRVGSEGPVRAEAEPARLEPPAPAAAAEESAPAEPAPVAQPLELESQTDPETEARRRVLLVEDEVVTREIVTEWLSPTYDVEVACDGFEGVSAVLQGRPDIVLLDLHLPRASGYEVLRVLRSAGVTVPVLVVSGQLARASDRIRALVLGASDLMPKPLQSFELLHKVDALLRYAPAPDLGVEADDAEALLGDQSARRMLDEPAFRERLGRAARFGKQLALPSSLVCVEARSADNLDAFVGAAEERLRPEDALLTISKRRAALLLVACDRHQVEPVLVRLGASIVAADASPRRLRFRICDAQAEIGDWGALFEDLEPWPRAPTE